MRRFPGSRSRRILLSVVLAIAAALAGATVLAVGSAAPVRADAPQSPAPVAPGPVVSLASCFSQTGHTDTVDATDTPTGWIPLVGSTQAAKPWNQPSYSAQCRAAFAIAYVPVALVATTVPTAAQTSQFGALAEAYAADAQVLTTNTWPASMMLVTTSSGSGSDGPNGVNGQYAFPNQNLLGNSWDAAQAYDEGVAMGTVAHDDNATGINTPEMSIERTWHQGRAPEGLGEDPELAS
jgi:hypothetical protein